MHTHTPPLLLGCVTFHLVYWSFWHLWECIALRTEYFGRDPAKCLFSFWDLLVIVLSVGCFLDWDVAGICFSLQTKNHKEAKEQGKKLCHPSYFLCRLLTQHDFSLEATVLMTLVIPELLQWCSFWSQSLAGRECTQEVFVAQGGWRAISVNLDGHLIPSGGEKMRTVMPHLHWQVASNPMEAEVGINSVHLRRFTLV